MNLRARFPHALPGVLWLALLAPLFFASYGWANHRAAAQAAVPSIVFDWERHIPFVPWTIVPYWSIDLFYGLSLLLARTRTELTRHALRLLTAQALCVAAFVLWPLRFSSPRPAADGWAGVLFDALAGFDLPYNQAPSLHIVLLLILWDFYRRQLRGAGAWVLHVWSALIGVSVLTTYQHHAIDIPAGLAVGALCLWLWPLDGDRPAWRSAADPARWRLAGVYAAGAAGLALAGWGLGQWHRSAWLLHWPALSLALVALCYAGLGEAGFQKGADGRHSLAVRLLMAPYRLGAWVNARAWTRRLPPSVRVAVPAAHDVWLGRLPLPWEADHGRFARVLDVTAELAAGHPGTHSTPWLDLVPPSAAQLRAAADTVQRLALQGPVLVCCALGFSRSAAVVATWACRHGGCASVDQALQVLRNARPQVVLQPALVRVISEAAA